jgi:transitional endoplasmic reticulum ATPase
MGRYYGESEQRLREVFQQAQQQAPSIIFIDEIDSIAPKREEVTGEVERRVVAQLLTLMDGLEPRQNVVVIGATNRVDAIDEALRRPGPLRPRDRDRRAGPAGPARDPRDPHARHAAGERTSTSTSSRASPTASSAPTCRARARGGDGDAAPHPPADRPRRRRDPGEVLENLRVTRDDFMNALKRVQPSALREIMIQVPNVGWDDIGGLEERSASCARASSCR